VIHALKAIINSVNVDMEESSTTIFNDDVFHHEDNNNECRISDSDTSSRMTLHNELRFTKNNNSDRIAQSADFEQSFQSSWASVKNIRSATTQTESRFPIFDFDSSLIKKRTKENPKKIIKSTQTGAMQLLYHNKKKVTETGCNTMSCDTIRKDAEISCDLIGSVNMGINIETMTEDKYTLKVEDGSVDKSNENTGINREVSSTKISSKLKDRVNTGIPAEMISDDFVKGTKENVHEENTNEHQEFKGYTDKCDTSNDSIGNSSPKRLRPLLIYDSDTSCFSEEIIENDEDIMTPESKAHDIPSNMITTFELAAERARNLHKAVMIYQENLKESERQEEETVEDYEEFSNEQTLCSNMADENCMKKYALFTNNEGENKIKPAHEAKCHFVMINSDFDSLSSYSSSSQTCCSLSSDQTCESCMFEIYRANHSKIEELKGESVVLSKSEKALTKPVLNESSIANVKSLMLVHHAQGEHAFQMVKFNDDEDGKNLNTEESMSTNVLGLTEKISFISRENLSPFICCILCTIVFWCLQFSFRCNPIA